MLGVRGPNFEHRVYNYGPKFLFKKLSQRNKIKNDFGSNCDVENLTENRTARLLIK